MERNLLLALAVFIIALLLAVQTFGQSPIGGAPVPEVVVGTSLDIYLRALRELGSFGALLYLMVIHQRERRDVIKLLTDSVDRNTATLNSLEQFIRDR